MKAIFITGSLNQGGAEFQILALARLFKENGNEVEVFALTDYNFYKPFLEDNRIKYSHLLNSQSKIRRIWLTSRMLKSRKPDIVISYLRSVSQAALIAKILCKGNFKLIIGERTSIILPKYDLYYFNLMRLVNGITVNSKVKQDYILNKFPALSKKVFYMPNLIDTDLFVPASSFGKGLVLSYVGRVSPEKNVISLVRAVRGLIKLYPDLKLNIYGDTRNGQYLKSVTAEIDELADKTAVRLLGKVEDVLPIYQNSSLVCLISDFEGFSNVIAESLSCGVAVIASDIEENRVMIEDGVNGFLVDQKNVQSIARGIEKFLQLEVNSKKLMRQKNRKQAEILFNKNKIYSKYQHIINNMN